MYAQPLQLYFKLIERTSIKVVCGHEILARLKDVGQSQKLGCLAGGYRQCRNTTFKGCNPFFEHVGSRVHDPGVNIAEFL